MRHPILAVLLALIALDTGCAPRTTPGGTPPLGGTALPPAAGPLAGPVQTPLPSAPATAGSGNFAGVKSWGYQLQNPSVQGIAACPFELLVIDYSRDGASSGAFSPTDLATMNGGGTKKMLSYLSIGEAENYRYYWSSAWASNPPAWLERPNPDWPGNYKVRYWMPEWQRIIYGGPDAYLDRIIAAGFDGAYLDIIDAYEYFEEKGDGLARQRMIQFVTQMAAYARSKKPGFGIFPQNGEKLLSDAGYVSAISGIGREETYFLANGSAGSPTPAADTAAMEAMLDRAVAAGKLVLTVDYTTQEDRMRQCQARARAKRYVEYCGVRELDRLVTQPR